MQPCQPLLGKGMPRRRECCGVIEGADMKVHLGWPAISFIGQCRTAACAEAALDTGRRREPRQLSSRETHLASFIPRKGRHRRARVLTAGMAVTECSPFGSASRFKANGATETSSFEPLHQTCW